MNISITNITTYLTTLTLTQLKKELTRVSNQYQGAQVRAMSDVSYEGWQKHISLIEEEIERRG